MPIPPGRQPIVDIQPLRWVEKYAPKCVAVDTLAAAPVTEPDSVDLVVRGGSRLRPKLGADCIALDFYSGDRKGVGWGKGVAVRLNFVGRITIKTTKQTAKH